MSTERKTRKVRKEETSGVPSSTRVGLRGQDENGKKKTAAVDPRTLPVWKGGPVSPGGIGVPPKKPS
jgi:hypothetical protein